MKIEIDDNDKIYLFIFAEILIIEMYCMLIISITLCNWTYHWKRSKIEYMVTNFIL